MQAVAATPRSSLSGSAGRPPLSTGGSRYAPTSGGRSFRTPGLGGVTPKTPRTAEKSGGQHKTPKTPRTPGGSGGRSGETYIMAITENRRREVGLAVLSQKRATITMSQFKDTARYGCVGSFLDMYPCTEIVLPQTIENGDLHRALREGEHTFSALHGAVFIKRQNFSDNKGKDDIRRLATEASVEIEVAEKYLALAAFHALIQYTSFGEGGFTYASKGCRVEYRCPKQYLQLDPITIVNLELVRNIRSGQAKQSLFGTLNHCKTSSGQRLLRTTVIQPLSSVTQLPTIIQRQEFVESLIECEDAFFELSERLPGFPDLEQVVATTLSTIPKHGWSTVEGCQTLITKILDLKKCLSSVDSILCALGNMNSDCALFRSITETLSSPRVPALCATIGKILSENPLGNLPAKGGEMLQIQRCFAVKTGIKPLLDIARQTFGDMTDDIHEHARLLAEQYELGSLKIAWGAKRGYHLSVKADPLSLPACFIETHQKGTNTLCTTAEFASYNAQLQVIVQEIYINTGVVMEELVTELRKDIAVLLRIADAVSLLDMLHSFAQVISLSESYIKPQFSPTGPLAIRKGCHPMAALYCQERDGEGFVPNNTFMGTSCRCCILTGPNMSGKSVYLRQVALIAILAHTGSFVPAEYACLPPMDRIFSRIGTGDDIQTNQSTFFMEMKEMAHIVQNATSSSLVIIDELGRGTSNHDGVGIAWACCEFLISTGALTLFATHYMELLQLPSIYPTAQNFHMAIQAQADSMVFLHQVVKGPCEQRSYGLYAAESMGFPQDVLDCAKRLQDILSQSSVGAMSVSKGNTKQLQAIYELGQKLMDLGGSSLDDDTLRGMLLDLKARFFVTPSVTNSGGGR